MIGFIICQIFSRTRQSHLNDLEDDTKDLNEIRLKLAKNNTTNPWTNEDVDDALKLDGVAPLIADPHR